MQQYVHGGDIYSAQARLKKKILDFSANLNPLGMPEKVRKAAEQAIGQSICYPDPFCRELVAAIARHEQVEPEQVICGNGAADLIFRLVLAVKPQKALLLAPTFAEYEQALHTVGCDVAYYVLEKETSFCICEDILQHLTQELDLVFLCNPNNPTGQLTDPDLLQKIITICQRKGIMIAIDECFQDFLDEPMRHSVAKQIADNPCLFILKAFTKQFGMAGLRLGYGMTANEALLDRMYQSGQPWSVSTPAQAAGIQALQEVAFLEKTQALIQNERRYLKTELTNLGFTVWGSYANYIFFQGPVGLAEQLEQVGIVIRKCSNYMGLDESYYRIAVKLPEENRVLLKAMQRL